MNRYFHAYTKKYRKRRNAAILLTVTPLAEFCMMIIWTLMFNLKSVVSPETLISYGAAVGGCIAAGMLLCWIYCIVCDRFVDTGRRYTYFEICAKAAVFSKYRGSYRHFGKRVVLRRVCVIPLKNYEKAFLDERKKHLILTGEIRIYEGEDKRLGYHIKDGFPVFDSWWYNEAEKSYKTADMTRLPMDFEHPGQIAFALDKAKREFETAPPKKEYVFKEADIVRKRKELKKMAESRRYLKYW